MIGVQKDRRAHKKKTVAVDMAPLIDMVFILLIFFIVTSTFAPETSVDISRPEMSSVSVSPAKSLVISIRDGDRITINDLEISAYQIESQVRQAKQNDQDLNVLVLSDKNISIDLVLKVLDSCRKAGVEASIAAKENE